MFRETLGLAVFSLLFSLNCHAFDRVECMDRPDGSVYLFERVPGEKSGLNVRIYHGWQLTEYSLPGLPIGVEEDFLNVRYDTRTAEARANAIASFSPLERLIFNMDIVFHHVFRDCLVTRDSVNCREREPIKIGREWISDVEFFFERQPLTGIDADTAFTIGIRGKSIQSGLEFSSGRRYFKYGGFSQCLYLRGGNT